MVRAMRAFLIALVLVGCNSKREQEAPSPHPAPPTSPPPAKTTETKPEPTPAPAAGGECADRSARLDKRLHELAAATPGFLPKVDKLEAPAAAAGKPFDSRGFVVAVAKDGTTYVQGEHFKTAQELGRYLDAMNKSALEKHVMAGGSSKDAVFPLYIWADREAAASAVAGVLATAEANGSHWSPRLVVAGAKPATAPEVSAKASAVAAKLPPSEPEATKYIADQLKAAMGECKDLIMSLATSTLEGVPQKQSDKLVADIPAGLAKCECKIPDPDVFEWGMHAWFGAWAPALAWVDMPKLAKTDKTALGKLVK
jgi:hypothetical protein